MTPESSLPASLTGADLDAFRAFLANQPRPQPWAEFVADIDKEVSKKSHHYHNKCRNVCDTLASLGVKTTYDLTPDLVNRYIASRPEGESPWTTWGYLAMLRTIVNHATQRRKLIVSPFDRVPIRRLVRLSRPKGKRHLSMAEIGRLLGVLRSDIETDKGWVQWKARRLYMVVCLGLYCGLRKMEILRLHVGDIDFEARVVRLVPHNKTGKLKTPESEQAVAMADALIPIVREWLEHRLDAPRDFDMPAEVPYLIPTCSRRAAWTEGNGRGSGPSRPLFQLQQAAARAGISHATLHMLRRSTATHLQTIGVPRSMISRILRHTREEVTEKWYQESDEDSMVKAVKDLIF
jgi:integrase